MIKQVPCVHSMGKIMHPFRELLKSERKFTEMKVYKHIFTFPKELLQKRWRRLCISLVITKRLLYSDRVVPDYSFKTKMRQPNMSVPKNILFVHLWFKISSNYWANFSPFQRDVLRLQLKNATIKQTPYSI